MAVCDDAHKEFEKFAAGDVQTGTLPPWTHVSGTVAWYVHRGPYSGLGHAWEDFHTKVATMKLERHGPPGEVYVCDPGEHATDESRILTVLWAPIK